MLPDEIGRIGERFVAADLTAKNYRCHVDTRQPGATDVVAIGTQISLRVQVKTALAPNAPAMPANEEQQALIATSRSNGQQAWIALVSINQQGQLASPIQWQQLV